MRSSPLPDVVANDVRLLRDTIDVNPIAGGLAGAIIGDCKVCPLFRPNTLLRLDGDCVPRPVPIHPRRNTAGLDGYIAAVKSNIGARTSMEDDHLFIIHTFIEEPHPDGMRYMTGNTPRPAERQCIVAI